MVKHGRTRNDKQRYKCKDCGRSSRAQPQAPGYTADQREQILRAYAERSSLRGVTRTFGVARNTVSGWLKKIPDVAAAVHHIARAARGRAGHHGLGTR